MNENETKKILQILGSCQRNKKSVEHEGYSDTNNSSHTRNSYQKLGKETGGIGIQRKDRDDIDHSIAKIGRNTQETLGNLIILAVI